MARQGPDRLTAAQFLPWVGGNDKGIVERLARLVVVNIPRRAEHDLLREGFLRPPRNDKTNLTDGEGKQQRARVPHTIQNPVRIKVRVEIHRPLAENGRSPVAPEARHESPGSGSV